MLVRQIFSRLLIQKNIRPFSNMSMTTAESWEILRASKVVCFDVDSTVSPEEGIDELAEFLGKGPAVAELTNQAMGGSMPFHEALQKRLELMNPSRDDVAKFLAAQPPRLTPGIASLIGALRDKGKEVYLVSGGFRALINPLADKLDISIPDHIFANDFIFNEDGSFAEFDGSEPTSRAGGKAKAVASIKAKHGGCKVVMIGDGMTDCEARFEEGGADLMIGYGGIKVRPEVKETADVFVMDFDEIKAQI